MWNSKTAHQKFLFNRAINKNMLRGQQVCSNDNDCDNRVCYDKKYCVNKDPVTNKGVCYYGRCNSDEICQYLYPDCGNQFVPTTEPVVYPTTYPTTYPTSYPTTSPPPLPAQPKTGQDGLGALGILGIVVGSLLGVLAIYAVIAWFRNRKKEVNPTIPIRSESM